MKIDRLDLTNWLCHAHRTVEFAPLAIVSGPNSSGKSPIGDAIAFAISGDLRRVDTYGERYKLLTEGTKAGKVTLTSGSYAVTRDIATGKHTTSGTPTIFATAVRDAVPFVLAPERFAAEDPLLRAIVLRKVMRVDLGPAGLLAELKARGHREDLLAKLPEDGAIDAWIKAAEVSATEARGAWKATAGETYGALKAETWAAPMPDGVPDQVAITALTTKVTILDLEQGDLQKKIGEAQAKDRQGVNQARQLTEVRRAAAGLPAAKEAEADFATLLAEARTELAEAQALRDALVVTKGGKEPPPMCCPHCGKGLRVHDGTLVFAQASLTKSAPAAATPEEVQRADRRVAAAKDDIVKHEAAHAKAASEVHAGEAAETLLAAMAEPDMPSDSIPHRVEDLERELADVRSRLAAARDDEAAARGAVSRAAAAQEKTTKASSHHADAKAWVEIAAALAPDGIPGELLRKTLGPFNETLRTYAAQVGWKQPMIGPDMSITAEGRPYSLLGESERWRVDALLGIALAVQSELRFLLIDRFDVIEPQSRVKALGFFLGLTKAGLLDTIVVMATMKEPMAVPSGASLCWLGSAAATERKAA